LIAAAAWSTSGLFIRWTVAISGVSALSLAFWRDLATCLCALVGVALLRPAWLRVERRDLPWFLALGAIGVGIFHFLWGLTILNIGYAAATVLLYAGPAYVTLMAWLIWREPLTRFKILAILMIFAGCVLVAGREQLATIDLTAGGLILGLVTAMAYGSFSLLGRQVAPRYSPWTVLVYGFGFGALALLPFQLATSLAGSPPTWSVPPQAWVWFAGLVLLATIVPFGAYIAGLRWLPVSVASIIIAAEVAFGALVGYLFFGETLTLWQILGATLVVAGVVLITITGDGRSPQPQLAQATKGE
jgi:drug/metabolite transporter (DMT)-like permease